MNRRRGLALVAAALALLALWLVLRDGREGRERSAEVDAPAPAEEPAAVVERRTPPPVEKSEAPLADPGRVAVEPRGATPADGLVVRVVTSGGAPAPGARVLWFDSGAVDPLEYEEHLAAGLEDLELVVARFGRVFRADDAGVALVPFARSTGSIAAEHEGEWAREHLVPEAQEVVLALAPDCALSARVVDARGESVPGELVVVRQRANDGSWYHRTRVRSDGEGLARFPHAAWLRAFAENGVDLHVGVEALLAAPVQVPLAPWPAGEVRLALPETAALEIELAGPDGAPWEGRGSVEVGLAADEVARSRVAGHEVPVRSVTLPIRGGRARLERVGLGLGLRLFVRPEGWREHAVDVVAPAETGASAVVRVALEHAGPSLSGRVVDAAGRALASRTLRCSLADDRMPHPRVELRRTDGDGRFAGVGGSYLLEGSGWTLSLSIAGQPSLAAEVALAPPIADAPRELGDVVLAEPPLLVRGRVVDELGHGVRAAELALEHEIESPWRPDSRQFFPLRRGKVLSAADGSFELRGWTASERMHLVARRAGFQAEGPLELAPGADGITVVLRAEGAIEGRMAVAWGTARKRAQLALECGEGDSHPIAWPASDSFRAAGLHSGRYALVLRLWSMYPGERGLAEVEVRAGETTTVPPIDLDALVTTLRFDVRDEAGAPIPGALFRWSDDPAARPAPLERDADGAHLLPTLELPLASVDVGAPGFHDVRLEGVSAGQRVVLARGPRVRLVLEGGLPPIGELWRLRVNVTDEAGTTTAAFDAAGEARLALASTGSFRIGLQLERHGEIGLRGIDAIGWWTIEVADSGEEQTFVSPPLPDAVLQRIRDVVR